MWPMFIFSSILLLIVIYSEASLVPPYIENQNVLYTRNLSTFSNLKFSMLTDQLETSVTYVFFCPPASFIHHQITIALELYRRAHKVVFATLEGFKGHLDAQLKYFEMGENIKTTPIEVLELDVKQDFTLGGRIADVTQTHPKKREFNEAKRAMKMYEDAFDKIANGLDRAKALSDHTYHKHVQKLYSSNSLWILAGPWATPIRYCRRHGLPYVIMLPTPSLTSVFSSPIYNPAPSSNSKNFNRSSMNRFESLLHQILPNKYGLDTRPANNYPSLRLVQSIPALTHLKSYSPLTVFTGPVVSKERSDPRHLSGDINSLLSLSVPVVYISLGTYAQLGTEQIDFLADAFFPYDKNWGLIWALSNSQQEKMSNGTRKAFNSLRNLIVMENWISTPAVLNHSKTLLFISHCGANGLAEAVVTGTPVLGLPLFGDQTRNCASAEENLGIAVCRSMYDTAASELRQLVVNILFDAKHPIYENTKTAKILSVKGYHGAVTAADWIEVASATKGDFSFLTTPPERDGVFHAYCLDIFAVITICVIGIVSSLSWCVGICQGRKLERKNKFKAKKSR